MSDPYGYRVHAPARQRPPGRVHTTELLAAVAERLSAAGYPAEVVTGEAATQGHVTDPDGCRL